MKHGCWAKKGKKKPPCFLNNGSFVSRRRHRTEPTASGGASKTSGVGGIKSGGPFMWKIQSVCFSLSGVSTGSPAPALLEDQIYSVSTLEPRRSSSAPPSLPVSVPAGPGSRLPPHLLLAPGLSGTSPLRLFPLPDGAVISVEKLPLTLHR